MSLTRWPSSLRARLTLWYTLLLGAPLVAFAVVSYAAFAQALAGGTDRFIGDALTALSREVIGERRVASAPEEALRRTISEVRFRDLQVVALDSARRVVATTALLEHDEVRRPPANLDAEIGRTIAAQPASDTVAVTFGEAERGHMRILARRVTLEGQRFTLAGAYPLTDNDAVLTRIRRLFWFVIPVLVAAAATSGSFIAKRSLAPVSAMAARAAEITASNMHERLPVGGGDELVRLARVVNDLLDRLEQAFDQQRRFVADASHELRTPTAILRAEADVTLSRDHRSEAEYRESLLTMETAAKRLTRIVEDLFLLARADSATLAARRDPVSLDELIHDVVRGVRSIADSRGVRVSLTHAVDAPLLGDADLLGRLVMNLLDNAIKHTPKGGSIEVRMDRVDDRCTVTVTDSGEGIPADAQARVFERFFRADAARSRAEQTATSGAGLGLSIGRRIAEMHGGALVLVESRPGRTVFRLTLPIPASSSTQP
jgi:heavy metal sensor kinase